MTTFHVLTDFSDAAANALQYAVRLAQHVGGRVRIWHIVAAAAGRESAYFNAATAAGSTVELQHQLRQLAEAINRTWQGQLVTSDADLPESHAVLPTGRFCTADIWEGPATTLLTNVTGAGMGHVLVLGNSNPDKLMSTARYSTALHMIHTLMLPLLVVPVSFRSELVPRRIVLDTDRRAVRLPLAAETIPWLLAQLTESDHALTLSHQPEDVNELLMRIIPEVVGIHVYTNTVPPELEEIAYQVQQTGLLGKVAHTVFSAHHSSIEEGIRRAAADHHADLLTFVTRQRMYAGTNFLYSVSAGLLAHSRIPVLTVPEL